MRRSQAKRGEKRKIRERKGSAEGGDEARVGTASLLCNCEQKVPAVRIALTDPEGAALVSYYKTGEVREERKMRCAGWGSGLDDSDLGRVGCRCCAGRIS